MNNYAKVPASKPTNSAIYQLPAVNINGSKFYGWKMVYFKSVDTGKKDKHGNEIFKSVPDKARPVVYDQKTQQIQDAKQSRATLSTLLLQVAKQRHINAQLLMKIAQLSKENK